MEHLPPPLAPGGSVPAITVLDSGLTAGHPLIGPAVGDAQGFVFPNREPGDQVPSGHGTFVAGLALYGDVEDSIRRGHFVPTLRLLSGKVFNDDGTDQTEFVERSVEEAVRYFLEHYGCRVFNLSYGDSNKVYDGRHLRGLAYTLDRLSRTLNVLFVTASGNRALNTLPKRPRERYPEYQFEPDGRLLDPGTALNAVTVGGLSRYIATRDAQRHPNHLEDVPVAQIDQPSPITRCGPSIGGAIKPDFVEHAGNVAVDRLGRPRMGGLGVLSLNSGFAAGHPFCEDVGTSHAAPVVAHKAARLLGELPDASPNLLRALLGAHASWPDACAELLDQHRNQEGRVRLLRAIGYGRIREEALYRSLDHTVTLVAEETIEADRHHFFEIPVPAAWWDGDRRRRVVSVALAYAPEVRTTRLDYRATRIRFSFVNANGLDDVTAAFRRDPENGIAERSTNRWISSDKRSCGTLQVSRWRFGDSITRNRLFVVVTRQDAPWSPVADQAESYALCVVLEDREKAEAEARLYAEVRAVLQARARVRIKV
ncbi:MAG: S8 family serine peptidase [Vicinamibacteraceae bacterium]